MKHQVDFYTPGDDDSSFADKYPDKVPDEPDVPPGAELVWKHYCKLAAKRTAGFSSPNPITYSEVRAYIELTGVVLRSDEIEAIMLIDDAWRGAVADFRERQKAAKAEQRQRRPRKRGR